MTLYVGVALVTAAVLVFILYPIVKWQHASLEREEDELTDSEARKRLALLSLRDVEYDFLSGKLDQEDYRSLKSDLTSEALAALEEDEAARESRGQGADSGIEAEIARIRASLKSGLDCRECGFSNETGSRFCSSCGVSLGSPIAG